MKRRTALRNIGLGFSAGVMLPPWLSACATEDPGPEIQYDGIVAVVGAGAAGLYAADILRAKGLQVILFEASGRVGGRIRSIGQFEENPLSNAFPIELGAERIIGSDSLWSKIVKQLERPLVEFPSLTTDCFLLDGTSKRRADTNSDVDFTAAANFFDDLKNYSGDNVSVQHAAEAAGLNPRVHSILNSWIGNKYGTTNDKLSATALAEGLKLITRNSSELRLTTNPMQDVLSSRFSEVVPNIRFDHAVKSINYSGEKILIQGERKISSTASESFSTEVNKVIVTVPVSILKDGDIAFTPSLPDAKNNALLNMEMDPALRVVLEFKQNFWGVDSSFLYGGTKVPEYFNVGAGETNAQFVKMLSMTIMGQKAKDLSDLGDDIAPAILEELDIHFEGKATVNIRKELEEPYRILSVMHNWTDEPYIRGGVAYVKPGGTNNDRITLGEPVEEKLFFAGEATDRNGEFGTINGALLSAERVALEVVDSIVG